MTRARSLILAVIAALVVPSTAAMAGKILLPQKTASDGVSCLYGNAYFYCPARNGSDDAGVSNYTTDPAGNTLWQSKSNWIWGRSGTWSLASGSASRTIWGSGNDSLITAWKGSSGAKLWNIYAQNKVTYLSPVKAQFTTTMKVVWDASTPCP